jgi:hypothetical protein
MNMNDNNSIDELKRWSDEAEERYQQSMRARRDAVAASQEAARAAGRARAKYVRALGQQGEEGPSDG